MDTQTQTQIEAPPDRPKPTAEQQATLEAEQQRTARLARAQARRALQLVLHDVFPAAFPRPPHPPVPLAVGVDRDLIDLVRGEHSGKTVRRFLQRWTSADAYLQAVVSGVPRRHLDGTEAGTPTDGDREYAAVRLAMLERQ